MDKFLHVLPHGRNSHKTAADTAMHKLRVFPFTDITHINYLTPRTSGNRCGITHTCLCVPSSTEFTKANDLTSVQDSPTTTNLTIFNLYINLFQPSVKYLCLILHDRLILVDFDKPWVITLTGNHTVLIIKLTFLVIPRSKSPDGSSTPMQSVYLSHTRLEWLRLA